MRLKKPWKAVFTTAAVLAIWGWGFCLAAAAENLVRNPSAECATRYGQPEGWGIYVGAGQMTLTRSTAERHSGQAAACLKFLKWHQQPGMPETPENQTVRGAIMLCECNGYGAKGALPCAPGETYCFSFWYKGSTPSATFFLTGWPTATADAGQRVPFSVVGGNLQPSARWQRYSGSFRIPADVRCFAPMIRTGGKRSQGFTLSEFYVDDAEVYLKAYPDGQIRGAWWSPKVSGREEGIRVIDAALDRVKAAGLNSVLVWISTLYLAALDRPELHKDCPHAAWDSFGVVLRAAAQRDLQVHAWFPPSQYKQTYNALELREHPQWSAVSFEGLADKRAICFIRPEVRQFELDLLAKLVDRYPTLAGIHLEEAGYSSGNYCYCDYCRELCREWYGIDIRADLAAAAPLVQHLAASMSSEFVLRLRQMTQAKRPAFWLSANGSTGEQAQSDAQIGRDWFTWAHRGYIDFYVPMIYREEADSFRRGVEATQKSLGPCDLVPGIGITWSSIQPRRVGPDLLRAQIGIAKAAGSKGFMLFSLDAMDDQTVAAVRAALDRPPANPRR